MKKLTQPLTAEEFSSMADDGLCWELVRGEIRKMPPPGARHGSVTANMQWHIECKVRARGLGRVFAAETGFLIERDPDTVRAADVAFVAASRLPAEVPKDYLSLAPDLVVETRSPGDRPEEVDEKIDDWLRAGVRLVWAADPEARTVTVRRPGLAPRTLGDGEVLDGGDVIPGLRIPVARLWD